MRIPSDFLQRAHCFMLQHDMICSGETVVIGFSGGVDSLVLLLTLYELRHYLDCQLHIAHLDHQLRRDSAADAEFAEQQANRLKLPFTINRTDIPTLAEQRKQSIEAAAREARYKFFESVCKQTGATKVALGHQRDDQAETVLINLLRGAALTGLRGILPIREGKFIRPLLEFSRLEIEGFANERRLQPREDSTNYNRDLMRNRIRLELLPLIERDYNCNIKTTLAQNAKLLRDESHYLDGVTYSAFNSCLKEPLTHDVVVLDRLIFLRQHRALRRRLLRLAIGKIQGDTKDLAFNHSESMLQLSEGEAPNRKLSLPNNLEFLREYDQLIIQRATGEIGNFEYVVSVSDDTHFPALNASMTATIVEASNDKTDQRPSGRFQAVFDAEEIQMPLKIRSRQPGDRFRPFGMGGTKKVKDFLIDTKVPRHVRQSIPILVAGDEILWVVGYRTSEKCKISHRTRRILHLGYLPDS